MDVTQSLSGEAQARHESKMFLNQRTGRNSFVGFIFIVILLLALCTSKTSKTLRHKLAGRELIVATLVGVQANQSIQAYSFFVRIDIHYRPWCGGSLVAPDVILTAAHCQPDGNETMTAMINGYHRTFRLNSDQEYRHVEYMLPHPEYDGRTFHNDIMLLKLSDPVTVVPWVELNRDSDEPKQNKTLTVMGLGAIFEGGPFPEVLQAAEVEVVDHSECRSSYANLLGVNIEENIMLCAGSSASWATDSCQGDSGGPLINQAGQQVGVISFGYGCAREGFPGVYARTMVHPGVDDWLGASICSMTTADFGPEWCSTLNQAASQRVVSTSNPTAAPTAHPTSSPTATPTAPPTPMPTGKTANPTAAPTANPTSSPKTTPTVPPTPTRKVKTANPTAAPAANPTSSPKASPTAPPTSRPTVKTANPMAAQTANPAPIPKATLTAPPTQTTKVKTANPTPAPTAYPASSPKATPTAPPTPRPTVKVKTANK